MRYLCLEVAASLQLSSIKRETFTESLATEENCLPYCASDPVGKALEERSEMKPNRFYSVLRNAPK